MGGSILRPLFLFLSFSPPKGVPFIYNSLKRNTSIGLANQGSTSGFQVAQ